MEGIRAIIVANAHSLINILKKSAVIPTFFMIMARDIKKDIPIAINVPKRIGLKILFDFINTCSFSYLFLLSGYQKTAENLL